MTRLIDADKLHTLFDNNCVGDCNVCNFYTSVHYVIHNKDCKGHSYCGLIDNAPTVDTDLSKYSGKLWKTAYERGKNERPLYMPRLKGHWIRSRNMSKRSYQRVCDQCHNISYFCGNGNYPNCPYCLADMRGEDNGS